MPNQWVHFASWHMHQPQINFNYCHDIWVHNSSIFHRNVQKRKLQESYFVYMSQWGMVLHCNAISHWLGAYTEWSMSYIWKSSKQKHYSDVTLLRHLKSLATQLSTVCSPTKRPHYWPFVKRIHLWPVMWKALYVLISSGVSIFHIKKFNLEHICAQ